VRCVIHRENLVADNVAPKLNEILYSVIKCINFIKANAKTERLFQKFSETLSADHELWRNWRFEQEEILAEVGPPANTLQKIEKWIFILNPKSAENSPKNFQKTKKYINLLKTKRKLNTKI